MATQEINCSSSALYILGVYKIYQNSKEIIDMISKTIAPTIKGFDDNNPESWNWNNWEILRQSFAAYDTQKNLSQGGTSKSKDSNDSSKLMIQISKQPGVLVQIYNILKDNQLLKNPEEYKIVFEFDEELEKNIPFWKSFVTYYENIIQKYHQHIMFLYTIIPLLNSPFQRSVSMGQLKVFDSITIKNNLSITAKYIPDIEVPKPRVHGKPITLVNHGEYSWNSSIEYDNWLTELNDPEYKPPTQEMIKLSDLARYHRIPIGTLYYLFNSVTSKIVFKNWRNILLFGDPPNYQFSSQIISHTLTQGDIDNMYFMFSGINSGYYVYYCECATNVQTNTGLPNCFGMYLSDVCTNCSQRNECRSFNNYLYPSNLHSYYSTIFNILPEQQSNLVAGDTIRLLLILVKLCTSCGSNTMVLDNSEWNYNYKSGGFSGANSTGGSGSSGSGSGSSSSGSSSSGSSSGGLSGGDVPAYPGGFEGGYTGGTNDDGGTGSGGYGGGGSSTGSSSSGGSTGGSSSRPGALIWDNVEGESYTGGGYRYDFGASYTGPVPQGNVDIINISTGAKESYRYMTSGDNSVVIHKTGGDLTLTLSGTNKLTGGGLVLNRTTSSSSTGGSYSGSSGGTYSSGGGAAVTKSHQPIWDNVVGKVYAGTTADGIRYLNFEFSNTTVGPVPKGTLTFRDIIHNEVLSTYNYTSGGDYIVYIFYEGWDGLGQIWYLSTDGNTLTYYPPINSDNYLGITKIVMTKGANSTGSYTEVSNICQPIWYYVANESYISESSVDPPLRLDFVDTVHNPNTYCPEGKVKTYNASTNELVLTSTYRSLGETKISINVDGTELPFILTGNNTLTWTDGTTSIKFIKTGESNSSYGGPGSGNEPERKCPNIWDYVQGKTYMTVGIDPPLKLVFSGAYSGPCPQGAAVAYDNAGTKIATYSYMSYANDNIEITDKNTGGSIMFVLTGTNTLTWTDGTDTLTLTRI